MKIYLIAVFLFIFIFAKCKKDKDDQAGQFYGYAKATANGNWVNFNKARAWFFNNNIDSVSVLFERWDGSLRREVISFGPMIKAINMPQRIKKAIFGSSTLTSSYTTVRDDGDVLCDVYHIYEPDSLQNFITITAFDPQTKEIRGTFQATFLIDPIRIKCMPTAPDTIRIRNGEFYTKIF